MRTKASGTGADSEEAAAAAACVCCVFHKSRAVLQNFDAH
jgi:hypothetical protein